MMSNIELLFSYIIDIVLKTSICHYLTNNEWYQVII